MTFRSVFIGIDRYASRGVSWLSCCARDAKALSALFTDSIGGTSRVLLDAEATRESIRNELAALSTTKPDDVVVIYFSGHGSGTHQLITHDADPADLPGTALALSELGELFTSIPAKNVWCILDCCFSGGMGAKVLRSDLQAKGSESVDAVLKQVSGQGRVILAASGPNEEAWESRKHRHGLLTHFLLEGLQGPEEIVEAGKLRIYHLLDYVSKRVADAATQMGKAQHPAIRGTFDGDPSWPILRPGASYRTQFPEAGRAPATEAITSLGTFGFPEELLTAWAGAIPSLNALQVSAINELGILDGEHLVVSAPTSSGKTLIGELAGLRGLLERQRAVFLMPLKALVADKHLHFERVYGPLGVQTIEATGDSDDISDLLRGQYDIALLTYEKFTSMVLAYPHVLEQIGTLVIDEVQMIADDSRGATLEFLMTLVRMRERSGTMPQLIALSAVIGDTNGLERWLGAKLLRRNERPVPLNEGVLRRDGSLRYLDGSTGEEKQSPSFITPQSGEARSRGWIIPLAKKLVSEGKQVIVFRETKAKTSFCAQYLAEALGLPAAEAALALLPAGDEARAARSLRDTLRGGVAFHHADLTREERRVIEEQFRAPNTTLRIIVATTTLAMGVNTPAQAVIIEGLDHPLGQSRTKPYTIAEYKNLVGRAGRLGMAERGESYLMALQGMQEHRFWDHYVQGTPEDLVSRFLDADTDIRSLILRVCAFTQRFHAGGISANEVADFLESSFGAWQQKHQTNDWRWNRVELEAQIRELVGHRLLRVGDAGHLVLTALGRIGGEGGLAIDSVVRIVESLSELSPAEISDPALIAACQWTVELDNVLFPINRKSTLKEPAHWRGLLAPQAIPHSIVANYQRHVRDKHDATLRAKRAVACLYYIAGLPMGGIEQEMIQFGGAFNASGAIRSVADRTGDVLGTACRIAEILHPGLDLAERADRLLVRLNVGVPGGAVEIARHVRGALSRDEYRALANAGFGTVDAINGVADDVLLRLVGESRSKVVMLRRSVAAEMERRRVPPVQALPLPAYEP